MPNGLAQRRRADLAAAQQQRMYWIPQLEHMARLKAVEERKWSMWKMGTDYQMQLGLERVRQQNKLEEVRLDSALRQASESERLQANALKEEKEAAYWGATVKGAVDEPSARILLSMKETEQKAGKERLEEERAQELATALGVPTSATQGEVLETYKAKNARQRELLEMDILQNKELRAQGQLGPSKPEVSEAQVLNEFKEFYYGANLPPEELESRYAEYRAKRLNVGAERTDLAILPDSQKDQAMTAFISEHGGRQPATKQEFRDWLRSKGFTVE